MKHIKNIRSRFWTGIFSWFIIGATAIFIPLFIIMTMQNLDRQSNQIKQLLREKGEALIRSFEAGARTAIGMRWSTFEIQKLLIETAQQPGVDYIILIDTKGRILADSDPYRIGEIYGTDLDLPKLSLIKEMKWRQVPNTDGADTFEVYRVFRPTQEPFSAFLNHGKVNGGDLIIFVGLDMGPVLSAHKADREHIIWMTVILLLIGCSGVISLFIAYRYRVTRTSLSRIQAFSDQLVENMPMGLVAVDTGRRVAAFNTAAESILGKHIRDILGKPADQVLPPFCLQVLDSLSNEHKLVEKELDCPLDTGKTIPLEVIASALEENGEILGSLVLFRDLTEIQALKKEVARSQHLASLGSLAAGIAHEIRNPLSSIKGFATYFKERYRDIPEDKETANIMVNEVERLNGVISQLLEFARPLALNRRETSLTAIVRHSLRLIEDQARIGNISIMADSLEDIALDIDADKMKQVLLNLFLNAAAAMEKGGTLSVRSFRAANGRSLRLVISDTGTGIRKEDLNRVFDPYFTTKPSGTGLGLAIVQKIMEAHDGEISLESEPGRGTTVTLTLPVRPALSRPEAPPAGLQSK